MLTGLQFWLPLYYWKLDLEKVSVLLAYINSIIDTLFCRAITNLDLRSPAQKARDFANLFLDEAAQARMACPLQSYPKHDYAPPETFGETEDELTASDWGRFLLIELSEKSALGIWLDWKVNVFLLLNEWGKNNGIIDPLFCQNGIAALTVAERQNILNFARRMGPAGEESLFIWKLQSHAKRYGKRLMVMDNGSDGILLFVLPDRLAKHWHLAQFGDALIVSGEIEEVHDPRSNGKKVKLFA